MMQYLVHPLYLFLLVWGGALTLYLGGVYQGLFSSPSTLALLLVSLNVVTFTLGYLTWTLFRSSVPADPGMTPMRPLTRAGMTRALRLTLLMGVIALGLEMYRVMAIAQRFGTTWTDLMNHPELFRIRIVTFIDQGFLQASGTVMLLSATNALFWIGFILLGVLLYLERTWRLYVYLGAFLAISLTLGLIHLSRCETTANVLYLVFAYCFMAAADRSRCGSPTLRTSAFPHKPARFRFAVSYRSLLIPAAVVVLLFAANETLLHKSSTYDQPNPLQGFLFHLYWYIASPLAAFNEFVMTFTGDHLWGQSTFLPLYKWLCRFHLARETEVAVYGEFLLIPYATNVYTYLRNFYEDFGAVGVAIVPYVLGWLTAVVQARARRSFPFLNLYLLLLVTLLLSFYNYFLASTQMYLQVLFGFLLFRYELPSKALPHGIRGDRRDRSAGGTGVEPAGAQPM